ncbi:MAG: tRNA dimethylallyltransferase, partial [Clostridia bacterium]|nr:tRNA dimethylallyltransferase [Clostridia bacterium]
CDPGTFFTMADFQRMAYDAIDGIHARGRIPFLVGGTGLYIDAVCKGYVLSNIEPDLGYRRELEKLSTHRLAEMLREAMPDNAIDPRNRNRVMRQLEKLHDGDTLNAKKEPRYEVLRLGVTWDRKTLCGRIDERLDRRMAEGMLEEVQGLLNAGVSEDFLYRLGLEYRYISQYLLGKGGTEEYMLEELSKAIKRFAKRQMTWFRRDQRIHWLEMDDDPMAQASELIEAFLAQ